jgi:tRNA(Ile)-lysidine synthase
MEILARVRGTIRRHGLAPRGTRVVLAVSGGSDSVALAHLMMELDRAGDLHVAALAHYNHQLRADADRDERFCAELAAALARPFVADHGDVRDLARREHRSIEDAAHLARHDFLERARVANGAETVAVGHTKDDQAETFLLRLLRGAGSRGLAAMHPRRDAIIRPLLDCRRGELRDYLNARGLPFVYDTSNDDVSVPRNRVRAELLPVLAGFNPSIVDVLADEADVAREEWKWMETLAGESFSRAVRSTEEGTSIDAAALAALPAALARLIVRRALLERAGEGTISFAHVEEVRRLAAEEGPPIDLPGQRVKRIGLGIVLTGKTDASRTNLFQYSLSIPGEVHIPESGQVVSAERAESADGVHAAAGTISGSTAVVQLSGPGGPLTVRNRRPGDRFRPLGLGGGKKLQDFFVDRKVARQTRDSVPLVVDESDRIIWVAGYTIDERFRVTDPAQGVVVLRLKPALIVESTSQGELGGPA